MALTPDGSRAVSGCLSPDNTLRVWDLRSDQYITIYYAAEAVANSPTDGRIVCGTTDGQMHFLTVRNFP